MGFLSFGPQMPHHGGAGTMNTRASVMHMLMVLVFSEPAAELELWWTITQCLPTWIG